MHMSYNTVYTTVRYGAVRYNTNKGKCKGRGKVRVTVTVTV